MENCMTEAKMTLKRLPQGVIGKLHDLGEKCVYDNYNLEWLASRAVKVLADHFGVVVPDIKVEPMDESNAGEYGSYAPFLIKLTRDYNPTYNSCEIIETFNTILHEFCHHLQFVSGELPMKAGMIAKKIHTEEEASEFAEDVYAQMKKIPRLRRKKAEASRRCRKKAREEERK